MYFRYPLRLGLSSQLFAFVKDFDNKYILKCNTSNATIVGPK